MVVSKSLRQTHQLWVTLTRFISISHFQVVAYPWEYWNNVPFPSWEETFFGHIPLLLPSILWDVVCLTTRDTIFNWNNPMIVFLSIIFHFSFKLNTDISIDILINIAIDNSSAITIQLPLSHCDQSYLCRSESIYKMNNFQQARASLKQTPPWHHGNALFCDQIHSTINTLLLLKNHKA